MSLLTCRQGRSLLHKSLACEAALAGSKQSTTLLSRSLARNARFFTQGHAPMPRITPQQAHQQVQKETATPSNSLVVRSWQNGNLLIYLGWTGLALIVVDRFLQYQLAQEAASARQMAMQIQEETRQKRYQTWLQHQSSPTLYQARIVRQYAMGGSQGLDNTQLGQVVEVLQENVGPDEHYHLCKSQTPTVEALPAHLNVDKVVYPVGWYPNAFLERVPEAKKKNASRWVFWK
jgi:hypothetical protein